MTGWVYFLSLFSFLDFVLSQWYQSGGNAQHTGIIQPALSNRKYSRPPFEFPFVVNEPLISNLVMDSQGNFFAASRSAIYSYKTMSVSWTSHHEIDIAGRVEIALSPNERFLYYSIVSYRGLNMTSGALDASSGKRLWTGDGRGRGAITVGPVTGNVYFSGEDLIDNRTKQYNCSLIAYSVDGIFLWMHTEAKNDNSKCLKFGASVDAKEEQVLYVFRLKTNLVVLASFRPMSGEVLYLKNVNRTESFEFRSPVTIYQNFAYLNLLHFTIYDITQKGAVVGLGGTLAYNSFAKFWLNGTDFLIYTGTPLVGNFDSVLYLIHPNGKFAGWGAMALSGVSSAVIASVTLDGFALVLGIVEAMADSGALFVVNLITGTVAWTHRYLPVRYAEDMQPPLLGSDGSIYYQDAVTGRTSVFLPD